jgi:hypothetical protein
MSAKWNDRVVMYRDARLWTVVGSAAQQTEREVREAGILAWERSVLRHSARAQGLCYAMLCTAHRCPPGSVQA